LLSLGKDQHLLAFQVLKAKGMIERNIRSMINHNDVKASYSVVENYDFGGYAKSTDQLINFIRSFYIKHSIKLEPVYTGKMMFGLFDMMRNGSLKNKAIVAVHTGGLQAVSSDFFNEF
jgi:1-aminocyclopropane-1-carboxylate deaminase